MCLQFRLVVEAAFNVFCSTQTTKRVTFFNGIYYSNFVLFNTRIIKQKSIQKKKKQEKEEERSFQISQNLKYLPLSLRLSLSLSIPLRLFGHLLYILEFAIRVFAHSKVLEEY